MKKIFLIFIISLAAISGVAVGQEAASDSLQIESKSVYELIKSYQAMQGSKGTGLPKQASFLASAKINLIVGDETVGVVLQDGAIDSVSEGGVEDPTIEFKTSRKYFNSIITSKRPLKRITFGLGQGFIMKRSHGIGGKSKDKVFERAIKKLDMEDPKVQKKIAKKLSNVGVKRGNKFVIAGARGGLEKTSIEIGGGVDLGEKTVEIEEFTGYRYEAPEGIRKMDLEEGEESLGVYVKIEVEDTEELTIKIDYDEEELEYALLDEDTLTIKWLNEESGKWLKLREGRPKWVKEVGVNKDENYVFAVLVHASVYGVAGDVIGVNKLEAQKGYEPAYFESPEEIEKIRERGDKRGILDRVLDFILGLVL